MNKKLGFVLGGLGVALVAVLIIWGSQKTTNKIDYSSYDAFGPVEASEVTGGFEELVIGNADAPVKFVEYGNYQCTGCAPMNPYINRLVEESDGKVAVIFRTMNLPYHDNEKPAMAAALAAAKQGYWKEYKDLLFEKQDEWFYSTGGVRQQQFEDILKEVSGGKADVEQFRTDMKSKEVAQKMTFDNEMALKADAQWSPYILLDGELISQKKSDTEVMPYEDFLKILKAKAQEKLDKLAASATSSAGEKK